MELLVVQVAHTNTGISWIRDTGGEISFGWKKIAQEQDISV